MRCACATLHSAPVSLGVAAARDVDPRRLVGRCCGERDELAQPPLELAVLPGWEAGSVIGYPNVKT